MKRRTFVVSALLAPLLALWPQRMFQGCIRDFRAYDRALTPVEVRRIYEGSR